MHRRRWATESSLKHVTWKKRISSPCLIHTSYCNCWSSTVHLRYDSENIWKGQSSKKTLGMKFKEIETQRNAWNDEVNINVVLGSNWCRANGVEKKDRKTNFTALWTNAVLILSLLCSSSRHNFLPRRREQGIQYWQQSLAPLPGVDVDFDDDGEKAVGWDEKTH